MDEAKTDGLINAARGAVCFVDNQGHLRHLSCGEEPAESAPEKPGAVGFQVDGDRRRIEYRGTWLDLTPSEYRLIVALVRRPGRVFSREELMALAWDDPGASLDRTVDAHIKAIRAKIRVVFSDADPIETRRGFGYALRPDQ